jgi:iron-sulfur cluster repair protein YtfE (RIC family)
MERLEEILQEIKILRKQLDKLIGEKDIDDEILSLSKMIDVLLNEYYNQIEHSLNNAWHQLRK